MTHDWITDRLPTAADADGDGDVRVPRRNAQHPEGERTWYQHYTLIVPGQPWWSSRAAQRVEPAPTLSLAVGQQWRRRDGKMVVIKRIDSNHRWGRTHPFWADGHSYTEKGSCKASGEFGHPYDLIELVSGPEPAPAPTRKVVQIAAAGEDLFALCDDGTTWTLGSKGWIELPAIPQPEA
jgi:hypothetical protein